MIQLQNLTVGAGSFQLRDIELEIEGNCYAVLMGRTGSGKTTLLETICGLKPSRGGKILFGRRDVTHLKPSEREIGYVPQDGALFQNMTVRQHLEFALRIRRWPAEARNKRVEETADMIGIAHLLHRYPQGLSGGEAQRVALGRALSFRPRVLCMDEPLSALDDDTRGEMMDLLKRVQHQSEVTALHVTHNRQEAARLADVLLHITDGQVVRQANLVKE